MQSLTKKFCEKLTKYVSLSSHSVRTPRRVEVQADRIPQEEVEIIDRHTVMMITISRPPFAFFPFAFGGNVRQGCESNVAKFKMVQVENIWRKVEPYVQKELYIIGVYDNGWQIRLLN